MAPKGLRVGGLAAQSGDGRGGTGEAHCVIEALAGMTETLDSGYARQTGYSVTGGRSESETAESGGRIRKKRREIRCQKRLPVGSCGVVPVGSRGL